jgi:hypothetical protein
MINVNKATLYSRDVDSVILLSGSATTRTELSVVFVIRQSSS